MTMSKIIVKNPIQVYSYMGYLSDSIKDKRDFKWREVNQLGARLSGKTTSDNIELIRAIIAAKKIKVSLVVLIFRMRHKEVQEAWWDIIQLLKKYRLPIIVNKGKRLVRVWTSKIYVKGCYTTNSTEISLLGQAVRYGTDYGILVFEEAREFDLETVNAVLVAIRGIKYQTTVFRSNPYHLANWYVQKCYREVNVDEGLMLEGNGNQLEEKEGILYHYMRCDVNPFIEKPSWDYLNRIKKDNPLLARTEYYGLPGSTTGLVFASLMNRITTKFSMERWGKWTAGVDVGYVSSAMAAGLWALGNKRLYKIAEYYHSNKDQRYKETIELAQELLTFYQSYYEKFKFAELDCYVDSADPGFISLLNTTAMKRGMSWFLAQPCIKIAVKLRISWYTKVISKGTVFIHESCKYTLQELQLIAYDEKAEDDKVKLVKQNDHTWDSDMYALAFYMKDYLDDEL